MRLAYTHLDNRADNVRVTEDLDYAKAECDPDTYVVIATQHKGDYEALHAVLRQRPARDGLAGSGRMR